MPSATAVFNRTLTNLGPLTTTFTPAPSCTALAGQPSAGYIFRADPLQGPAVAHNQHVPYGSVACTPQDLATCYPDGEARQSILVSGYEFTQAYNSPGYYCPAGWTAVGSATYANIIKPTRVVPTGYDAYVTGFALSALDQSETVTMCCPSGYDPFAGDFQAQFGCTSSIGPASSCGISERCFNDRPTTKVTFEYWGGPVTKIEPVPEATTEYTRLPLETVDSDTSYEIFHTMPNIVLINRGDASATATPTATRSAGDGKEGKKNAASGQRANVSLAAAVAMFVAAGSFWGFV